MTDDARDFLKTIRSFAREGPGDRVNRLGTVYTTQGVTARIQFDGESIAGLRYYPTLAGYTPAVGDRVLLLPVGSKTSYVIVGAVAT